MLIFEILSILSIVLVAGSIGFVYYKVKELNDLVDKQIMMDQAIINLKKYAMDMNEDVQFIKTRNDLTPPKTLDEQMKRYF